MSTSSKEGHIRVHFKSFTRYIRGADPEWRVKTSPQELEHPEGTRDSRTTIVALT
jgi:hypothetical protein